MSARRQTKNKNILISIYKSVWLYPLILGLLLIILTALRISGTSVDEYYEQFYGSDKNNSSLLTGEPESVRSDEWLYVTQMTIAQEKAGFPRVNPYIQGGRDMTVIGDAPVKDWSEFFRPDNLIFFVLPLEYAFAFKWWLILFLAIIGSYFLILRFFSGKRLLAAILGTAFAISPYFIWWYQTATFEPVFCGLFIILLCIRIFNNEPIPWLKKVRPIFTDLFYIIALGYLLTTFALVLYPPFQIPIIIADALFLIGYVINKFGFRQLWSKTFLKKLAFIILGGLLSLAAVLGFIYTRSSVISAVNSSVYPGSRIVPSGGTAIFKLLNTYLLPQLQNPIPAAHYFGNQSEASNFFLFLPFLLLPGFVLIYLDYRKNKKIDWELLLVQLGACLFLLDLFVGGLGILYKITFLDKVPHERLSIGLGFIGFLQLLCIARVIGKLKIRKLNLNIVAIIYTLGCLGVLAWAGLYTRSHYPQFISRGLFIGFLGIVFAAIIFCFLTKRLLIGSLIFLGLAVGAVYHIHPLYQGLGPLDNNKVEQEIDRVSSPKSTWVVVDNLIYENFPILSDRNSLSGIQLYPNLKFWRQVAGKKDDYIYNRYAHVLFYSDPQLTQKLILVQDDFFLVKFACYPFIENNVQYVLSIHPISWYSCVRLVGEVQYPATTFYFYKVQ